MISESNDFLAESEALHQLIVDKTDGQLSETGAFKGWSFHEIIRHLHVWNKMAFYSLNDADEFQKQFESLASGLLEGQGHREAELNWFGDMAGAELLTEWKTYYRELAAAFVEADPEHRVPWAGPPMSAQSSIIARLMETWSHAQAIYDELGVVRQNGDQIKSIAELGVRTYRWTFNNRQQETPLPKPHLRLTAPSGAIWTWNDESTEELVTGDAGEFCQVVVTGPNATLWMSVAQCFAGAVEDPPAKGLRFVRA